MALVRSTSGLKGGRSSSPLLLLCRRSRLIDGAGTVADLNENDSLLIYRHPLRLGNYTDQKPTGQVELADRHVRLERPYKSISPFFLVPTRPNCFARKLSTLIRCELSDARFSTLQPTKTSKCNGMGILSFLLFCHNGVFSLGTKAS